VRVRHLLEGSAGLAPWAAIFAATKTTPGEDLDLARVLALLAAAPLDHEPGHGYAPNGAGWTLLAPLIHRSAGTDATAWLRERVLAPLELEELAPCTPLDDAFGLALDCDRAAHEHDLALQLSRLARWPAPSWCGSARSVARFGEALDAGRFADRELLERWTRAAPRDDEATTGHGYALDVDRLGEHRRWFHDGGIGAFRVRMACYPDDDLVIAVIGSCPTAPVRRLEEDLARLALDLPAERVLDLPLPSTRPYSGDYLMGTTRMQVLERAGRIVLQDPEREIELAWQGGPTFAARTDLTITVRFELEGPRASGFELRRGTTTQRALRMD
jgi:CubicO group peptidase (beta-lactamase class C family)